MWGWNGRAEIIGRGPRKKGADVFFFSSSSFLPFLRLEKEEGLVLLVGGSERVWTDGLPSLLRA